MVLDTIFGFLLPLHPAAAVFTFSAVILVVINVFYRILINQQKAKETKERVKSLQDEYKKEQKAGNAKLASKLMSEALREQGKMMRMSMKPMIVSLIIVVLLLPWLAAHYGDVAATESFRYAGEEFSVGVDGSSVSVNGASCEAPCTLQAGSGTFEVSLRDGTAYIAPVVAQLPVALPLAGSSAGWLAWYIISSLPLALLTRRLMKINI